MDAHGIAEVISIILTFPCIASACYVVVRFFDTLISFLKGQRSNNIDWIGSGICIGFIGGIGDNCFWLLPWSYMYVNNPPMISVFSVGVFFNIFFRQGLGIVAAYLHAASLPRNSTKELNLLVLGSTAIGIFYVSVLHHFRIQ